jgi:hypothetical protein
MASGPPHTFNFLQFQPKLEISKGFHHGFSFLTNMQKFAPKKNIGVHRYLFSFD